MVKKFLRWLDRLDMALLAHFQQVSDWVSDTYESLSPIKLAIVCYWLVIIAWAASLVFYWDQRSVPMVSTTVFGVWSFFMIFRLSGMERADQTQLRASGFAESSRLLDERMRKVVTVVFMPFAVMMFADFLFFSRNFRWCLDATNILSLWCALYFESCTPRPPKPRKVEVGEADLVATR